MRPKWYHYLVFFVLAHSYMIFISCTFQLSIQVPLPSCQWSSSHPAITPQSVTSGSPFCTHCLVTGGFFSKIFLDSHASPTINSGHSQIQATPPRPFPYLPQQNPRPLPPKTQATPNQIPTKTQVTPRFWSAPRPLPTKTQATPNKNPCHPQQNPNKNPGHSQILGLPLGG